MHNPDLFVSKVGKVEASVERYFFNNGCDLEMRQVDVVTMLDYDTAGDN